MSIWEWVPDGELTRDFIRADSMRSSSGAPQAPRYYDPGCLYISGTVKADAMDPASLATYEGYIAADPLITRSFPLADGNTITGYPVKLTKANLTGENNWSVSIKVEIPYTLGDSLPW